MALDEKGIRLSEISHKYPTSFQPLGYDVLLSVDNTYKPKVIPTFEMCVNIVLTLLCMKRGQIPSIPDLGIDIESYLHEYADDTNIASSIKNKLYDQCNRLSVIGIDIECRIDKLPNGTNALIVQINGNEKLGYGLDGSRVIIGISYDKLNRLYVKKSYV